MKQIALRILWPAFLAAGVLETIVFAVVDPADLHRFNGPPLNWSLQAVYTVAFLVFWAAIATASATTALLLVKPAALNSLQEPR